MNKKLFDNLDDKRFVVSYFLGISSTTIRKKYLDITVENLNGFILSICEKYFIF
jgi:hypothetical protein